MKKAILLTSLLLCANSFAVTCDDYLDHFKTKMNADLKKFDFSLRKLCVDTNNLEYIRLSAQFYAKKFESLLDSVEKAENVSRQTLTAIDLEVNELKTLISNNEVSKEEARKKSGELNVRFMSAKRKNLFVNEQHRRIKSTLTSLIFNLEKLQITDFEVNYLDYGFSSEVEAKEVELALAAYVPMTFTNFNLDLLNNTELIEKIRENLVEIAEKLR